MYRTIEPRLISLPSEADNAYSGDSLPEFLRWKAESPSPAESNWYKWGFNLKIARSSPCTNRPYPSAAAKSRTYVHLSRIWFGAALLISTCVTTSDAETIRVRYPQGSTHGFLALRTLDGKIIATGESTQTVRGDQVTAKLIFHFRDGSTDDDETIFFQKGVSRLVSDHHIQHGPSFPKPIDLLINAWITS